MRRTASIIAAMTLLALPEIGNSVPVQASTGIFVTARDCVEGSLGPCEELGAIVDSAYGGRPGGLNAAARQQFHGYGTVQAQAELAEPIGAPRLGALAEAAVGTRVSTNSFGLQRYTYIGEASTTRTFGGTLTYSQGIVDPNNALYELAFASGVNARIRAFTTTPEFVDAGTTAESNYNNLLAFALFGTAPGYELLAEDLFADLFDADDEVASLSFDVTLDPGDSVWIFTSLQTPAGNGTIVDSLNTLVTAWNDTTELVPARVFVPEPGSMALVLLGLVGFELVRRRRATI